MNKGLKAWSANFGRAHAETNFVTGEAGQQESGESNPTNQAAELKRFASEFLELLQGSSGRNETALEAVLDLEGSYAVALAELTDERESGMADMQVCCTQTLEQFLLLNVTLLRMLMLLLMLITLLLLMLSLLPIVTLVVVPLPILLIVSLLLLLLLWAAVAIPIVNQQSCWQNRQSVEMENVCMQTSLSTAAPMEDGMVQVSKLVSYPLSNRGAGSGGSHCNAPFERDRAQAIRMGRAVREGDSSLTHRDSVSTNPDSISIVNPFQQLWCM